MLLLVTTTDKIQLVTGSAASLDVHATYADATQATPPVVDALGRQNTIITTVATTDVVAAPANTKTRNVKTLHVRNKHATQGTDVTVVYNQNATLYELWKCNLAPGEALEYVEGVGFFEAAASPRLPSGGGSTADQAVGAADAYLVGSSFAFVGRVKAGSFVKWRIAATKTAAGAATPIWQVRVGTAGTTADTSRITHTGVAQTGAIDVATFEVEALFRSVGSGSAGVLQSAYTLLGHRLAATGFATQANDAQQATSAGFDTTLTGSVIGLSVNPGTAAAWTIKSVSFDAVNLAD